MQVIKEKKAIFEKNFSEGVMPSPSLSQIIAADYSDEEKKKPTRQPPVTGLRDDLDDIDENDIGMCGAHCFNSCVTSVTNAISAMHPDKVHISCVH